MKITIIILDKNIPLLLNLAEKLNLKLGGDKHIIKNYIY